MVSEDVHDHQGLEAIKLIDLAPHLCPGLGPLPDPEAPEAPPQAPSPLPPPALDSLPAAAAAAAEEEEEPAEAWGAGEGQDEEAEEDEHFGLGPRRPWRVNEHSILEAGVPGGDPLLFCTTCYRFAVHPRQRGLCSPCLGAGKITGGSAYTSRKRLRALLHPSDESISLDEPRVPSAATRERWASHFGVALNEGSGAVGRLAPFSGSPPNPPLGCRLHPPVFRFRNSC